MPGTIAPGDSTGSLLFTDDLTLTNSSVLEIELGGTAAGVDFDWLNVTGDAALDGLLEVSLVNGFDPASGNVFTIISGGQLSGTFDDIQLPELNEGLMWQMSSDSNHFSLAVSTAVVYQPADFNEDTRIDYST